MSTNLDHLLQAYLDGSLSPARRAAVEKRLDDPRVARRLESLRALDALLAASAPEPSAAQSRRMWAAIQAQVGAAPAAPSAWDAVRDFFSRPWLRGGLGIGLAGAAAALVFVMTQLPKRPPAPVAPAAAKAEAPAAVADEAPAAFAAEEAAAPAPVPAAQAARMAKRSAAPMARRAESVASAPASLAAPAPAPAAEGRSLAKAAARPQTEVERALSENTVDDLIDNILREGVSSAGAGSFRGGERASLGGLEAVAATGDAHFDSAAAQAAQGAPDHNGFWNWRPAALALNRRDWNQAQAELRAAQASAREASERAFASSALSLLSAPGAPLQGTEPVLPSTGDLRVLGAGRWQLMVDSRLARFSQGVSARLPGFRAEGDSLLLDLTFDRGSFAPGTRFTRVSGEEPAKVYDASMRPVAEDDFTAPMGADYHVDGHELHLR